jgi:hypothetical protein
MLHYIPKYLAQDVLVPVATATQANGEYVLSYPQYTTQDFPGL